MTAIETALHTALKATPENAYEIDMLRLLSCTSSLMHVELVSATATDDYIPARIEYRLVERIPDAHSNARIDDTPSGTFHTQSGDTLGTDHDGNQATRLLDAMNETEFPASDLRPDRNLDGKKDDNENVQPNDENARISDRKNIDENPDTSTDRHNDGENDKKSYTADGIENDNRTAMDPNASTVIPGDYIYCAFPLYDHSFEVRVAGTDLDASAYSEELLRLAADLDEHDLGLAMLRHIFRSSIMMRGYDFDWSDTPDEAPALVRNILYLHTNDKELARENTERILAENGMGGGGRPGGCM